LAALSGTKSQSSTDWDTDTAAHPTRRMATPRPGAAVPAAPPRARWTGCSHVPWQVRAPAPHRVRGSGVPGGEGRRVLACLAATRPRRGRREDGREASAPVQARLRAPPPARRRSAAMVRRPWRRPRDVRMALCRAGWCARLALTPRAQASPSGRWASRSSRACRTAAGAPPPAPARLWGRPGSPWPGPCVRVACGRPRCAPARARRGDALGRLFLPRGLRARPRRGRPRADGCRLGGGRFLN